MKDKIKISKIFELKLLLSGIISYFTWTLRYSKEKREKIIDDIVKYQLKINNMDNQDKIYTLKEFWQDINLPNGLYAIWINKLILDNDGNQFNELRYYIDIWDEKLGFKNGKYLDWLNDFSEKEIKIKFLEELAIYDCL